MRFSLNVKTLNTQDNDPPDPIRSSNKCSKITEVEDEQ
jgi:hypothetical protein